MHILTLGLTFTDQERISVPCEALNLAQRSRAALPPVLWPLINRDVVGEMVAVL